VLSDPDKLTGGQEAERVPRRLG
jgi:hypothetical protein